MSHKKVEFNQPWGMTRTTYVTVGDEHVFWDGEEDGDFPFKNGVKICEHFWHVPDLKNQLAEKSKRFNGTYDRFIICPTTPPP